MDRVYPELERLTESMYSQRAPCAHTAPLEASWPERRQVGMAGCAGS
jgi:hypothetical protein